MDIITTTTNNMPKSPEPEPETPTRIQQPTTTKPLSFSNGVLKRHQQGHNNHHHPFNHLANPGAGVAAAGASVSYKECLKNHAASIGGHALDGCGEFMPAPTVTAGDPASIKCAACGCHRNFHRRESDELPLSPVIEYQPHHRHHPPPPPFQHPTTNNHHPRSPSSSPPPISSSYYPASAPHMLLALSSGGLPIAPENTAAPAATINNPLGSRKRFRTKFTPEQKEKMHRFADRVGWKIQKRDEDLIQEFCHEVGVDRGVLKVWMHNNKNTFGKRDLNASGDGDGGANANAATVNASTSAANAHNYGVVGNRNVLEQVLPENGNGINGDMNGNGSSGNNDDSGANGGGTNGSSSSS